MKLISIIVQTFVDVSHGQPAHLEGQRRGYQMYCGLQSRSQGESSLNLIAHLCPSTSRQNCQSGNNEFREKHLPKKMIM